MRSKKELGQVLLDNQHLFTTGLCPWVIRLFYYKLITEMEREFLLSIIDSNKPRYTFIHIFYNPDEIVTDQAWYWKARNIYPRIKWIKKYLLGSNE